ncbi:dTMP kinase [Bacillus salitolerans]|uniref:Thymidylate kinase n=1 Tax=Bacillus salitolerans TaxID=1437434 RepID=A0ABW4LK30_9BACI
MIIVFEGLNNCGKSTQIDSLKNDILLNSNYNCIFTSWNSYPDTHAFIEDQKLKDNFSPRTYSLAHALDFTYRYEDIIKNLKTKLDLAFFDRYYFTSFVRDNLRGIPLESLYNLYSFARIPDLIFYFDIEPETVWERAKGNVYDRSKYILGEDISYSNDKYMNYYKYLSEQRRLYLKVLSKEEYSSKTILINAKNSKESINQEIKYHIQNKLRMGGKND